MSEIRYLMNYSLFSSRRRFSLEKFLIANPETSYDDFCKLLVSKKVCPPSEDFFLEVKSKVNIQKKSDTIVKEKQVKVSPKKTTSRRKPRKVKSNED